VKTARSQLGSKFDYGVLANLALNDNFVGWLMNTLLHDKPKELLGRLVDSDGRWICNGSA